MLGVRSLSGQNKVVVRLAPLTRAERAAVAEEVAPWPRHPKPGRPPAPLQAAPAGAIVTPAQRAKAQRQRAIELLADDREASLIPTARIANKSVTPADWRDPADRNPNRREPRLVHGHRAYDAIEYFTSIGTFNKRQAAAARRLRDQFDRAGGVRIGYDRMQNMGGGFGPKSGLSEQLVIAIRAFERAQDAIGASLWPVVSLAILQEKRLNEIAARFGKQTYQVQPYLLAALDRLADYYRSQEQDRRREAASASPPET